VADASDESSEEAPAPKAKAKAASAKAAAKKAPESEDESDDEPAPKAKKAAAAPAPAATKKPVVEESDDESEEEKPAPKAKVNKAAPKADDEDSDDEKPAKKKAKTVKADEDDEDEEEAAEPPAKKAKKSDDAAEANLKVFVAGIPWSTSEEQVKKDFEECGEVTDFHMPKNEEGKPKGIAFITYSSQEGVDAALKFDGQDYGGRSLKVAIAQPRGEKGKGGDKGKGKGKGGDENTAMVRGLPWASTEESLKKDFEECGEIEIIRMPKNEEGQSRGIAFIVFKSKEAVEKACAFDSTDYGGRTIYVSPAGEGGKGKGKDGKGKGKDGKGKDGKGKSKGKKGKGGLSEEKKAAKDGAMVESTGTKQTFDDSDDE